MVRQLKNSFDHFVSQIKIDFYSLSVVQVAAALIQTSCVLSELSVASLLHLAEELKSTGCDGFALGYALSGIVQLLATQHVFLGKMICFDDDVTEQVGSVLRLKLTLLWFSQYLPKWKAPALNAGLDRFTSSTVRSSSGGK